MSQIFYKFLDENNSRKDMIYKIGHNVDPIPFDLDPICGPGGIYFCRQKDVPTWISYGPNLATLTVPSSCMIVDCGDKLKAHEIVISKIEPWYENMEIGRLIAKKSDDCSILVNSVSKKENKQDLYMRLIKWSVRLFPFIPKEDQTIDLCTYALKNNGTLLKHVRDDLKTNELYVMAVKNNFNALNFVPDEFITNELVMTSICNKKKLKRDHIFEKISSISLHCRDLMEKIVPHTHTKNSTGILSVIPKRLKTMELCMNEVCKDPSSILYVPGRLRTNKLISECLKRDGLCIKYLPLYCRTLEFATIAVKQNLNALKYVPFRNFTLENDSVDQIATRQQITVS